MKGKIVSIPVIFMIIACLLFSGCGESSGLSKTQKEYLNSIMSEKENDAQTAAEKVEGADAYSSEGLDNEVYWYEDESTGTIIYYMYWDVIDDYLCWFYIDGYDDPIYFYFYEEYDDSGDLIFSDFLYFIIDEESGELIYLNFDEEEEEEQVNTVEEPCYMCSGTGIEDCPFCLGKGYSLNPNTPCMFCNGKKTQTCHICHGEKVLVRTVTNDTVSENAGWVLDDSGNTLFGKGTPCARCGGSKTIACYSCHGASTVTKTTYTPDYGYGGGYNTIETTCTVCHGRRTVTCTLCFGRGTN